MDRCTLRVGRLISHRCGRKGQARCRECRDPRCGRHLKGGVCDACRGAWAEPTARLRLEDLDLSDHFAGDFAAFADKDSGMPKGELDGLDS